MIKNRVVETFFGALVLAVAGFFFFWAWSSSGVSAAEEVSIEASFSSATGLRRGSEVHIGGVKVGRVVDVSINVDNFQALVRLSLRSDLRLPIDSELRIINGGFLGGAVLRLTPGSSDETIVQGGRLENIAETLSLEEMLGRAIFVVTDSANKAGSE